jgi:putative transposase
MALPDATELESPWQLLGQCANGAAVSEPEDGMGAALGYASASEAQRDISHYLMHRYNWLRPHQFNEGLPTAVADKNLNFLSGFS